MCVWGGGGGEGVEEVYIFCLFGLVLNTPVNSFLVMSRQVFMGLTTTKQRMGVIYLPKGKKT